MSADPTRSRVDNWWRCPNEPRCPHGAILHDVDEPDDPRPTCCAEGCQCGVSWAPSRPGEVTAAALLPEATS